MEIIFSLFFLVFRDPPSYPPKIHHLRIEKSKYNLIYFLSTSRKNLEKLPFLGPDMVNIKKKSVFPVFPDFFSVKLTN